MVKYPIDKPLVTGVFNQLCLLCLLVFVNEFSVIEIPMKCPHKIMFVESSESFIILIL
jgi:hypothetical protein